MDDRSQKDICHYIRGRLAALDTDIHAIKNQRADRRFQLAANVAIEVARIRHAMSYIQDDCNFGKVAKNKVIPELGAFATAVLDVWGEAGTLDGGDLQELGVKHGLLVPRMMERPCGPDCQCNEYYATEEWPVQCFRRNEDGEITDGRALKEYGGDA